MRVELREERVQQLAISMGVGLARNTVCPLGEFDCKVSGPLPPILLQKRDQLRSTRLQMIILILLCLVVIWTQIAEKHI